MPDRVEKVVESVVPRLIAQAYADLSASMPNRRTRAPQLVLEAVREWLERPEVPDFTDEKHVFDELHEIIRQLILRTTPTAV